MKKYLLIAGFGALVVIIIGLGVYGFFEFKSGAPGPAAEVPVRIGLSFDNLAELRWQNDRDQMTRRAEEVGATVIAMVADSDDAKQISQIQNLITQKVDVLIVVAHDAKALSAVIDEARAANIEVIAYDRLILESDINMYISFDSEKVGLYAAQYVLVAAPENDKPIRVAYVGGSPTDNNAALVKKGAMSVLDPLIERGDVKLVFDKPSADWRPDEAYRNLKGFLDTGGMVDAVVAANDGTASGAIEALREHGLAGKVPVSGQDAELPALQRLVAGTQTVTSYKPIQALAYAAVDAAVAFARGNEPTQNNSVNNGTKEVPAYLIDPIPVTKANIEETVIKDGFHTAEEIYGTSGNP